MKMPISIHVRGKHKEWSFTFNGDPQHLAEWRADGLEVYELTNTIPMWVVDLGLTRPWCLAQDAWKAIRLW